jgi:hypothetical protein
MGHEETFNVAGPQIGYSKVPVVALARKIAISASVNVAPTFVKPG